MKQIFLYEKYPYPESLNFNDEVLIENGRNKYQQTTEILLGE